MYKPIIAVLISLLFCFPITAQTNEKIKGNKHVTSIQTDIDPFHTISIDEDFDIEIVYNATPSVLVESDENLHEFIKFDVVDGVLSFDKLAKITSKKRLNITVNYNDYLNTIKTTDSGEILSLNTMDLKNASLTTEGSSKASLTIKTDAFDFTSSSKAQVKLNLECNRATLNVMDRSKIEALISASVTTIDLFQRASASIEGETNEFNLKTANYAHFEGKEFTAVTCNTLNDASSDVTLEVKDSITIKASDTSSIYLYGDPKIIINELSGNSKIQKKQK